MTRKYDFCDIVRVISKNPKLSSINGKLGVISGKAQNEETGVWSYGVAIYEQEGLVWRLYENDIEKTGKKESSDKFMSGESIRVRVDPKTGEGKVVDED